MNGKEKEERERERERERTRSSAGGHVTLSGPIGIFAVVIPFFCSGRRWFPAAAAALSTGIN